MKYSSKNLLHFIAQKTNIYEGKEGIRAILRIIFDHGPIGTKDVSKRTGIPLPVISAVRRELEQIGILIRKNGMLLSSQGLAYVRNTLGFEEALPFTKHQLLAPNFKVPKKLHLVLQHLTHHVQQAPKFNPQIDQAPCTAETALRRALLMHLQGAIEGKNIALIGDDDLVSIAICLVARHLRHAPPKITVFDVDTRFMLYIQSIAHKNNFPIQCIEYDARSPSPQDKHAQFDTIGTDPPYSKNGALLFLSRGIELLKQAPEQALFFSFAHWPAEKKIALDKIFTTLGLSVESQYKGFNQYQGAAILGSTGTLFELRTTSQMKSPILNQHFTAPIYTAAQPKKSNNT